MADLKISAMPAASALSGPELLAGVQSAANVKITAAQIKTLTSASPTLVTPAIGVAAGTSLALGGATIGTDALGVTGTATVSGAVSLGNLNITAATVPANGINLSAANTISFYTASTLRWNISSSV